ncbi:MAG: hypothetical protein KGI81_03980 [Betaproteobacteria bacterium]|nr:hypothetical protein [Betaproteobacteria bacterium]
MSENKFQKNSDLIREVRTLATCYYATIVTKSLDMTASKISKSFGKKGDRTPESDFYAYLAHSANRKLDPDDLDGYVNKIEKAHPEMKLKTNLVHPIWTLLGGEFGELEPLYLKLNELPTNLKEIISFEIGDENLRYKRYCLDVSDVQKHLLEVGTLDSLFAFYGFLYETHIVMATQVISQYRTNFEKLGAPHWKCFEEMMDYDYLRRLEGVARDFHIKLNRRVSSIQISGSTRPAVAIIDLVFKRISKDGFGNWK